MNHTLVYWLIIVELLVGGAYVTYKGLREESRQYTPSDAFFGLIEIGLVIWGLTYIS